MQIGVKIGDVLYFHASQLPHIFNQRPTRKVNRLPHLQIHNRASANPNAKSEASKSAISPIFTPTFTPHFDRLYLISHITPYFRGDQSRRRFASSKKEKKKEKPFYLDQRTASIARLRNMLY